MNVIKQSASPAALAIAFTLRAICDSESPNTRCLPSTSTGRMASRVAMATGTGFRSGEPDHGEGVGGEGAGLPLGLHQATSPSFQRGAYSTIPTESSCPAHSWALAMADVASRMVAMLAPEPARAAR